MTARKPKTREIGPIADRMATVAPEPACSGANPLPDVSKPRTELTDVGRA